MSQSSRYDGKPLLRLIEFYVLDSIGALTAEQARTLDAMEPQLCQLYGTSGDWRAAIAKAMAFPDTLPHSIRELWGRNQEIAKRSGVTLAAEDFAVMFVDTNIPQ